MLFGDSAAGIADLERGAPVLVESRAHGDRVAVDGAGLDRVRGVDQHAQNHLHQLGLAAHRRRHGAQLAHDSCAVTNLVGSDAQRTLGRAFQIDRAVARLERSRKTAQIGDDAPHPLRTVQAVVQHVSELEQRRRLQTAAARGQQPLHVLQVGDHVRERIVDAVHHARRQRSDRGHAVAALQALLEIRRA